MIHSLTIESTSFFVGNYFPLSETVSLLSVLTADLPSRLLKRCTEDSTSNNADEPVDENSHSIPQVSV